MQERNRGIERASVKVGTSMGKRSGAGSGRRRSGGGGGAETWVCGGTIVSNVLLWGEGFAVRKGLGKRTSPGM